jgi:hypothetical protein
MGGAYSGSHPLAPDTAAGRNGISPLDCRYSRIMLSYNIFLRHCAPQSRLKCWCRQAARYDPSKLPGRVDVLRRIVCRIRSAVIANCLSGDWRKAHECMQYPLQAGNTRPPGRPDPATAERGGTASSSTAVPRGHRQKQVYRIGETDRDILGRPTSGWSGCRGLSMMAISSSEYAFTSA